MGATWSIQTPTGAPGAIGAVLLSATSGEALDAALARLGVASVGVGAVAVRDLSGVDRGIVARWSPTSAHFMPHGGAAVMRALVVALGASGLEQAAADPRRDYPEAATLLEARMLATLARAASPLAIDLLLEQPRRWSADPDASPDAARDQTLNRLVEPPLVVLRGPPNIGKSSLINALAGRRVALVSDVPGTTRDHVGVMVELSGLVVRLVDTPGVRATGDAIETEAAGIAARLTAAADLVLRCGDHSAAPPDVAEPHLTIATRLDLGLPGWVFEAGVSALTGEGLAELAGRIRERLVPSATLADPAPWRFWA
jgi:tRNA modification GTPase